MAWILLLLSVACLVETYFTTSLALGVVCMLLALVLVITATMLLLSARIGNATRNVDILSPEELRILREQAEARRENAAKAAASGSVGSGAASGQSTPSPPSAT